MATLPKINPKLRRSFSEEVGGCLVYIRTSGYQNGQDPVFDFVRIWIIDLQLPTGRWITYQTKNGDHVARIRSLSVSLGGTLRQFLPRERRLP